MSDWTKFVTAFYKKKHASNPDYKFKNAMKDAAKEYKKGSASTPSANKTKKSKKMSGGKSRKSKKSGKSRKSKK
jgi:hypothetical protein